MASPQEAERSQNIMNYKAAFFDAFRDVVRTQGSEKATSHVLTAIDQAESRALSFSHRAASLLEMASVALGSSDIGIEVAGRHSTTTFAVALQYLLMNAATAGEALNDLVAYAPLLICGFKAFRSDDVGDKRIVVSLACPAQARMSRNQAAEYAALSIDILTRNLVPGGASEIWVSHEPLSDTHIYERNFRAPLRFSRPFDAVLFDGQSLDLHLTRRDKQVYALARATLEDDWHDIGRTIGDEVRALITNDTTLTLPQLASALDLHPRTLDRRLRAEGNTFEAIKDKVRGENAIRCLYGTDLSLLDVSKKLGFRQHSTFVRSCKRQFSLSPMELRKRLRAD